MNRKKPACRGDVPSVAPLLLHLVACDPSLRERDLLPAERWVTLR